MPLSLSQPRIAFSNSYEIIIPQRLVHMQLLTQWGCGGALDSAFQTGSHMVMVLASRKDGRVSYLMGEQIRGQWCWSVATLHSVARTQRALNKKRKDIYSKPGKIPHSSTLAWKIPWMEEPGGLQSMGLLSQTRVSDFTFTFHFHTLEKEMATHSSVLAWRIPGTGEPDGLPSIGLHRVGHD